MQITIEIPDAMYDGVMFLKENSEIKPNDIAEIPLEVIAKGTPLSTGCWVGIDDFPYDDWECDRCGGQVYGTNAPYEEYKYCPNCGTKMEAQSNDNRGTKRRS